MPPSPPPPAIVTPPPPSIMQDIAVPAADNLSGHQAALAEIARRWPGVTVAITAEGMGADGLFHAQVLPPPTTGAASVAPAPPAPETITAPRAVIFLTGDAGQFGAMPKAPPSPGHPMIIATRGDSADHRAMDGRWVAAMQGRGTLWDGSLSWKYRTDTVVFRDATTMHTILEQRGLAIDCDRTPEDVRAAVAQCLSDDSSSDEDDGDRNRSGVAGGASPG